MPRQLTTICPVCWGSTLYAEYVPTETAQYFGLEDCAWCEGAGFVDPLMLGRLHLRGLISTEDFITAAQLTTTNGEECA